MKSQIQHTLLALALLSTFTTFYVAQPSTVFAAPLGTAFTYQGRLTDGGNAANGIYDLRLAIFDAESGGSLVAGPLTNTATGVTNGLFTVTLDFGSGVFTGDALWLGIAAKTNGAASFTPLTPRQAITAVPYASYASSADTAQSAATAASLSSPLGGDKLAGLYTATVNFNNPTNIFSGTFFGHTYGSVYGSVFGNVAGNLYGSCFGDGAGLFNLNADSLAAGTLPDARLSTNVALLNSPNQLFTGTNTFSNTLLATNPANQFVGAFTGNGAGLTNLNAANVGGAFSGNGGGLTNLNAANLVGTVSGNGAGLTNLNASQLASGTLPDARLSANVALLAGSQTFSGAKIFSLAPSFSAAGAPFTVTSGTLVNNLNADLLDGYHAGNASGNIPVNNSTLNVNLNADLLDSYHAGNASGNVAVNNATLNANLNADLLDGLHAASFATLNSSPTFTGAVTSQGDLLANRLQIGFGHRLTGTYATIAGGLNNTNLENEAAIGGGTLNIIQTNTYESTIGGGYFNTIEWGAQYSTIGGGLYNTIRSNAYTSTIGGGYFNTIQTNAFRSTIGGGYFNIIQTNAFEATISGGGGNTIQSNAFDSTIGGGGNNTIGSNAQFATVPGGNYNTAGGNFSFAAGRRAKATNDGAFVWADSLNADFGSTATNQFLIRASGGVGINKTNPATALDVYGTVTATNFAGNGAGLTNLNASQLASGTLPDARLSGTYSGIVTFSSGGNNFTGIGSGLTSLNANYLASGTVADTRLSANVALLAGSQTFSGTKIFSLAPSFNAAGAPFTVTSVSVVNSLNADLHDGYHAGNASGQIPVANGTVNVNLNADLHDGYHAGNASGQIPVANGTVNVNLNADLLDGYSAGNASGNIPVANGTLNANLNADLLDGLHAAAFATLNSSPTFTGTVTSQGDLLANRLQIGVSHRLTGTDATIAGGLNNTNLENYATIGGGRQNTIQEAADYSTISGGNNNTIQTNADTSTIGGGLGNTIQTNSYDSTIGGGNRNMIQTNAYGSTIGGGAYNTNQGAAFQSTISGGELNIIQSNAYRSTIGGGYGNTIGNDAQYATVPGGSYNTAGGIYSFAAGRRAKATNDGAFVWGDSTTADIGSTNDDSVTFRASGGYRLFSNSGLTAGVSLAPGGTSWGTLSDRNAKKNFAPVNNEAVLEKLSRVPVQQWNYKWESDGSPAHLGPMAQDFKAAFYPGTDDKSITTLEYDGVELAAIQGLNQKLNEKDAEIQALKQSVAELKETLTHLTQQPN